MGILKRKGRAWDSTLFVVYVAAEKTFATQESFV
jgi:hypothetical protein